jgi:hypothetical protein
MGKPSVAKARPARDPRGALQGVSAIRLWVHELLDDRGTTWTICSMPE